MKVFISWSGNRSRAIAEVLHDWLKDVVQILEPWMSSQDIDKGARWTSDIASELIEARIGIICLTKENIYSPWILFEAGALAKTLDKTFVCPYLFDLKPIELQGPLVQFQATLANESDTRKLVRTINKALGDKALPDEQLEKAFVKWWPELENALKNIPTVQSPIELLRSDRDLLEENLELTRQLVNFHKEPHDESFDYSVLSTDSFVKKFFDNEVREFATKIRLEGNETDPNAVQWFKGFAEDIPASLDGQWHGRWSGPWNELKWRDGTAIIKTLGIYVYVLYIDASAYLIATRREEGNRLIGRYFNLQDRNDSTPWVGLVIDDERIDGRWTRGRWDFRRISS